MLARRAWLAGFVVLSAGELAAADTQPRSWHAGAALRSDLGTHFFRLAGGIRVPGVDLTLVLDPLVVFDDVHDADLLIEPYLGAGWSVLAGVRVTSIGLAERRHWQDKLLIGVSAELPPLAGGALRGRFGLELATLVVRHGGGTGTDWLDFGRTWSDAFQLGLFARMELDRAW
ncbi:MAG: hypothetical protein WKG01_35545 [Kofleriaceae bacterium]